MKAQACVVLLTVAACSGVSPWIEPPEREPRSSLLADGRLAGAEIAVEAAGPWAVRSVTTHGAAGAPAGGPGVAGPTSPGGGGRYHGPGDAVPPSTGGVVTHSDEFYLGAGGPTSPSGSGPTTGAAGPSTPASGGPAGVGLRTLRAGKTDDNADHPAFLAFLGEARESGLMKSDCEDLDVADRRSVRVEDRTGRPLAGAEVTIVDAESDAVVWRGTTYGDGEFPFFPGALPAHAGKRSFLVEVGYGGRFIRTAWDGDGVACTVRWPAEVAIHDELAIDVVFLIDTTGSMSDEIDRIKTTLASVTDKLEGLEREVDLRYAAVLYRDLNDAYVTKTHEFSGDLSKFAKAIQEVEANGGGDSPESLNQGLAVAIDGLEWRSGVAKLVFLIADAPPHMDYEGDVSYGASLQAAVARGIKIHSVAASGLDLRGSVVLRQIAQFTKGQFVFIEYGGDVTESAKAHGVTQEVKSNNLDDILFEQIRAEVATWGRS